MTVPLDSQALDPSLLPCEASHAEAVCKNLALNGIKSLAQAGTRSERCNTECLEKGHENMHPKQFPRRTSSNLQSQVPPKSGTRIASTPQDQRPDELRVASRRRPRPSANLLQIFDVYVFCCSYVYVIKLILCMHGCVDIMYHMLSVRIHTLWGESVLGWISARTN